MDDEKRKAEELTEPCSVKSCTKVGTRYCEPCRSFYCEDHVGPHWLMSNLGLEHKK